VDDGDKFERLVTGVLAAMLAGAIGIAVIAIWSGAI